LLKFQWIISATCLSDTDSTKCYLQFASACGSNCGKHQEQFVGMCKLSSLSSSISIRWRSCSTIASCESRHFCFVLSKPRPPNESWCSIYGIQ